MSFSDFDLKAYISAGRLIIKPLKEDTIQQNGVDLHIGKEIGFPKKNGVLDLAENRPEDFFEIKEITREGIEIPKFTSILLHTEEYLKMPMDTVAICGLRSTFARLGFVSPVTYIDAGFEGELTIETFWAKPHSIRLYRGIRFLHVLFIKCLNFVDKPYKGFYQGQTGVRLPKSLKDEVGGSDC